MTSEVAILNKQAIALAADSAVTIRKKSGDKIFPSVNKIFMLSNEHPVGIMLYGGGSLMGIPWETLFKMYKDKYGSERHDFLKGYADNFIKFLKTTALNFFNEEYQKEFLKQYAYGNLYSLSKFLNKKFPEEGPRPVEEVEKTVGVVISDILNFYKDKEYIPSIDEKFETRLILLFRKTIYQYIKEIFGEDILNNKKIMSQIFDIAINCFTKFSIFNEGNSGVVIAGFGEKEIFPSLKAFLIDGIVLNHLIYKEDENHDEQINFERTATILPFAQDDMIMTFMTGMDPRLRESIKSDLKEIYQKYYKLFFNLESVKNLDEDIRIEIEKEFNERKEKLENDYNTGLHKYQKKHCSGPVMDIVASLPKTELASMAETFINLTSFKRKMSPVSETVAGPIDVAIISKGDGFIWIKRKYYYDPNLNYHSFDNI